MNYMEPLQPEKAVNDEQKKLFNGATKMLGRVQNPYNLKNYLLSIVENWPDEFPSSK